MQPKQYRKAIIKALEKSKGEFDSFEALADYLVEEMEYFEELFTDAQSMVSHPHVGNVAILATKSRHVEPPPGPVLVKTFTESDMNSAIEAMPSLDLSTRIIPEQEKVFTEEEITALKDKWLDYYKRSLPEQMHCQPPGFEMPMHFRRNRLAPAPAEVGPFIEVVYVTDAPNGVIEMKVNVLKAKTCDVVIREIDEIAAARFFSKPTTVQARISQGAGDVYAILSQSLRGGDISSAPHGEENSRADELRAGGVPHWNSNRVGAEINWKAATSNSSE